MLKYFDSRNPISFVSRASSTQPPSSTSSTTPTLTGAPSTSSTELHNEESTSKGPPIGAIVGGVVGGLAFIGIVVALVAFLYRRRRHHKQLVQAEPLLTGQSHVGMYNQF